MYWSGDPAVAGNTSPQLTGVSLTYADTNITACFGLSGQSALAMAEDFESTASGSISTEWQTPVGLDGLMVEVDGITGNHYLTLEPTWRPAPAIERSQPFTDIELKFSYTFAGPVLNKQYIAVASRYVDENNQVCIEIHPHAVHIVSKVDANSDQVLEVDETLTVYRANAVGVWYEAYGLLYDDTMWLWLKETEPGGVDWSEVTADEPPILTTDIPVFHTLPARTTSAQKLRVTLGGLGYTNGHLLRLDDLVVTAWHDPDDYPSIPVLNPLTDLIAITPTTLIFPDTEVPVPPPP